MKRVGELYYFTAVFDEDGPIASEQKVEAPAGKVCRRCNAVSAVLHHDPDRPTECQRVICGKCQGDANREIMDRVNPVSRESRNGY